MQRSDSMLYLNSYEEISSQLLTTLKAAKEDATIVTHPRLEAMRNHIRNRLSSYLTVCSDVQLFDRLVGGVFNEVLRRLDSMTVLRDRWLHETFGQLFRQHLGEQKDTLLKNIFDNKMIHPKIYEYFLTRFYLAEKQYTRYTIDFLCNCRGDWEEFHRVYMDVLGRDPEVVTTHNLFTGLFDVDIELYLAVMYDAVKLGFWRDYDENKVKEIVECFFAKEE